MSQDGDTRTSFSDDRLAMENSVKGEAILILITGALKKGTEPGLALEPGCEHSWDSDKECSCGYLGNRRLQEASHEHTVLDCIERVNHTLHDT